MPLPFSVVAPLGLQCKAEDLQQILAQLGKAASPNTPQEPKDQQKQAPSIPKQLAEARMNVENHTRKKHWMMGTLSATKEKEGGP